MAVIVGNTQSRAEYKMEIKGDAKDINIGIGDEAIKAAADTDVQKVMKTMGKTASKVIEGGGDIITAPAVWLKDMQKNWLMYMMVAATILLTITFLYCVVRYYFARKQALPMNNLLELSSVFANKNATLQRQLPLSTYNLPSVASNLIA